MKNSLNGNLVKDSVCRHRCIYGVVELRLAKRDLNIAQCPVKGENEKNNKFFS